MDNETIESFALYRLEKAKQVLDTAEHNLKDLKDYASANNRAYYAIFYAIRAVLVLEEKDFKKHKDVIAYFNQYYVHTEVFPKKIGRKISQAQYVREKSDYDDKYEPSAEKTEQQIETARELIILVEKYINEKIGNQSTK